MTRRSTGLLVIAFGALLLPLLAFGQEVPVPVAPPAAGLDPTLQYLLGAGPLGALVYGAWLLGKGVNIKVQVDLAEDDRELIRRGVSAAETIARRGHPDD